ncbi:hypothetical protein ACTWJ8_40035 (plasmid) [Streptomyces sp. SDT5-1]|uniref:hypothetical protein n=1 Tax=Streptomyces sp. SDT5-1 TaxID=3406418 RepID=UPI003FD0C4BF
MNTSQMVLAGALSDLGDSWIGMLGSWSDGLFKVLLVLLVVYVMATRFSLKAGVGALLLMVLALGIYDSRTDLSDKVEDEVKNPAKSSAELHVPYRGGDLPPRPSSKAGEGT